MFPDQWPGIGLLILRVTLAVVLLHQVVRGWSAALPPITIVLYCLGLGCAGLLLCGLWTPVAAGLITLVEFVLFMRVHEGAYLLTGTLGLVILMLGPGVWSIDSRLFGRRRIDLEVLHQRPRSG
jgi:uncharacterized membrane protein YphA (DoxX/SURF4 family)